MPARNTRKSYVENGYYHLYNRGVEKRPIFIDGRDYDVYKSYLKDYLSYRDNDELYRKISQKELKYLERDKTIRQLNLNNYFGEISLLAYCLMPNHFHLLIKQKQSNNLDSFMNSIGTRYVMYFNKKYNRVGHLFQGVYKAVLVESDEQLLYLSRYIHQQSLATKGQALGVQQPSSYNCYTGVEKCSWIDTKPILSFYQQSDRLGCKYEDFVTQKSSFPFSSRLLLEN